MAVKYDSVLYASATKEIERIKSAVDRLVGLVDESIRLLEMRRLYEGGTPSGRQPDPKVLSAMREREAEVEAQVKPLLPMHQYFENLRRLVAYVDIESGRRDLAPDALESRRRNQWMQVRQYVQWMREREERAAAQKAEAASNHGRATGPAAPYAASRFTLPRSARNESAHQRSTPREGALALLNNDQGDGQGTAGDQIAIAVHELMLNRGIKTIRFADLYRSFLKTTFREMFDESPSEGARIEAFRYHFAKAARRHGLRYEAGGSIRLDLLAESADETGGGGGHV